MYQKFKDKNYASKVVELYLYTKEYKKAIEYLEDNQFDNIMLFELYKNQNMIIKALKLSKVLYKTTGNYNYLAQDAILEYESTAKKSKKLLENISTKLTKAIQKVKKATYYNYLGYLLIDHDLDYKKGLFYVKQALLIEPGSPYYLDSLAWGYYKQKEYKKAYYTMQDVVAKIGKDDKEIKKHLKAISKKYKPKKGAKNDTR
jgi:tetratricopeptide (TPR) repeat protein